jgi:tRNA nucleotidyltransferase/poly(A) polymerase
MIPEKVRDILLDLRSAKWMRQILMSADAFIVGGCVRDAFMNKPSKDIDIIIEGLPLEKIHEMLKPFGKVDIVGESFSVIKFRPKGFQGEPYDIATPRQDRKIGSGHKGFEIITDGVTIEEDLKRRDFTYNSIAVDIKRMEILDPFNGLKDLKNNILRATDNTAFTEDPLRIIRGIQFASRFGSTIEPNTLMLMRDNADLITEISGERIFEELNKILTKNGDTSLAFKLLHQTEVDRALFGEKMFKYTEGLDKLDPISFYYVLGVLGGVNPAHFIKTRLKGDANLEKNVRILDHILTSYPEITEKEDFLHMLFKAFEKAPEVMTAQILPMEIDQVVAKMQSGKLPKRMQDIQINGNDVIMMSDLRGAAVGQILDRMLRDALMDRYDWKNRGACIDHLSQLT